jgi:predicted dehydrogenase
MAFNLAFFGAGETAQPYLAALRARSDVRVAAVCDPDRRAAEQTAAGWGAQVFDNPATLLQECQPDALWVCVPPALQGDVLPRAIERRVPFFVEPPGAADFADALRCAALIAEAKLVTAVGFWSRYADVAQEAHEYLGANAIPLALGWWLCPAADPPLGPGLPTEPQAAARLWEDACRLIDSVRFFCGEVTRVRALSAGAAGGGLVVQLETANGTVGVVTCATFARPEPRVQLELLGEGWSLGFGRDLQTLRLDERDKTTILRCLNHPAARQAEAFLEAVAAGKPELSAVGYGAALRTLATCHAAALSAREDRPVTIAELMPPA